MRGFTEGTQEEKHFFSQRRRRSCRQDERTRVAALQGVLGNKNHTEPLTMDANIQKILFNDWILLQFTSRAAGGELTTLLSDF